MTNNIKFFEIRDRATCIPVMVTHICDWNYEGVGDRAGEVANRFFEYSGFGDNDRNYFLFTPLNNVEETTYNSFRYSDRTFFNAYNYIENHWNDLTTGDVIDVRVILGEEKTFAKSEIFKV